jgi:hypothetical protein
MTPKEFKELTGSRPPIAFVSRSYTKRNVTKPPEMDKEVPIVLWTSEYVTMIRRAISGEYRGMNGLKHLEETAAM